MHVHLRLHTKFLLPHLDSFVDFPLSQRWHSQTSCKRAAATICPAPLLPLWAPRAAEPTACANRNGQYFPTLTAAAAWCVNAAVSKSGLVTLTFDIFTSKVVFESRITWATSVPILVFLCLSVIDLGPMYATDRRQTASSLNAPAY